MIAAKCLFRFSPQNGHLGSCPPATPLESLQREIDRLFDDFAGGMWRSPFGRSFFDIEPAWRTQSAMSAMPAVDVTETDKAYEIAAELPG
jgi:HSP20 family protein